MDAKNREGESALLTASARGFVDIVECLVEHMADLEATDKVMTYSRALSFNLGYPLLPQCPPHYIFVSTGNYPSMTRVTWAVSKFTAINEWQKFQNKFRLTGLISYKKTTMAWCDNDAAAHT